MPPSAAELICFRTLAVA